ncbi:MAG: hypothetical protein ABIP74_03930 [Candidatus Saccharimonas sp.]
MINLLAPNDRRQLTASRTNSLILRYIFLMSVVIAVMALEMLGVFFILNADKQRNADLIAYNDKQASAYQTVQQEADIFRSNLAISKYVLSKQTPYTSIIFAVAQALPPTATLDSLSIVPSTFGTPVTISVQTDTSKTAIDVKAALQNASYGGKPIFTAVSFNSLTAPDPAASKATYTAAFSVTFSKEISSQ